MTRKNNKAKQESKTYSASFVPFSPASGWVTIKVSMTELEHAELLMLADSTGLVPEYCADDDAEEIIRAILHDWFQDAVRRNYEFAETN